MMTMMTVPGGRVLAIGLDGLEVSLAERLMAEGELPALAELRRRSARFLLDHGPAQRTGLAWEHVASGLSPEAAGRWAAVEFDPRTYRVWQDGAQLDPWWKDLDRRVVVFDTPYVDLRRAPNTRGIVAWGAHDPGTSAAGLPAGLLDEFLERFGRYPAAPWTYGIPWPSPERTREMGEALSRALDLRTRAARWLMTERLPDWDLFFVVAGEAHGAIEGLWHGVDPTHPLHTHPSGVAADAALRAVHRGLDRMVAELTRAAGDATVVAFAMGGMGPNHSDIQSMVLLPELLYRHAFGRSLLTVPTAWAAAPRTVPILAEDERWETSKLVSRPAPAPVEPGALRRAARSLPIPVRAVLKGVRAGLVSWRSPAAPRRGPDLVWQPAYHYGAHWPQMPAFALPSFYDGRIRINLRGRERDGIVEPVHYEATCRELETLLRECRDPRTGEPAVADIERAATRNPLALASSECDLLVVWRSPAAALEHPRLGLVGPVPLRRTGGHTGRHGVAYVAGRGVDPGDRGVRSAFDVAPAIAELLGAKSRAAMSGASLLDPHPASR
jgi:predicted AlkP superfamily phosphohydrolase/phosphomutase